MSLNAATIEFLLSKGLDGADLLEVARLSELRSDPSAAKRMKEYRERRRNERDERNVTRNAPPNEVYSNPPDHSTAEASASSVARPKSRRTQKTKLVPDWQPAPLTAGTEAWKVVQAWQPGRIERELSKFRDHHTGHGSRMDDWQAAWRTWITKSQEFENRNGRQQPDSLRGTRPDPALDMWKQAQAELAAERGHQEPDIGTWPALPPIGAS